MKFKVGDLISGDKCGNHSKWARGHLGRIVEEKREGRIKLLVVEWIAGIAAGNHSSHRSAWLDSCGFRRIKED